MKLILEAIKALFRKVELMRTHWDTRETINTPKATVSGTTTMWGYLKVADAVDFDINSITHLTRSGSDGYSFRSTPVSAVKNYSNALDIISYDDWWWGVYLPTQEDADAWWNDSESENPFTPGLYMWSDGGDIHDCEITYAFTLTIGELKKLDEKYLPDDLYERLENAAGLAAAAAEAAAGVEATLTEKISAPAIAEVGQIIVVKAVDDEGKPTEWEAADLTTPDYSANEGETGHILNRTHYEAYEPTTTTQDFQLDTANLAVGAKKTVSLQYGSGYALYYYDALCILKVGYHAHTINATIDSVSYDASGNKTIAYSGTVESVYTSYTLKIPPNPSPTGSTSAILTFVRGVKNYSYTRVKSPKLELAVHQLDEKYIPDTIQRAGGDVIVSSSAEGSTKKFKITVDDMGIITATEVAE